MDNSLKWILDNKSVEVERMKNLMDELITNPFAILERNKGKSRLAKDMLQVLFESSDKHGLKYESELYVSFCDKLKHEGLDLEGLNIAMESFAPLGNLYFIGNEQVLGKIDFNNQVVEVFPGSETEESFKRCIELKSTMLEYNIYLEQKNTLLANPDALIRNPIALLRKKKINQNPEVIRAREDKEATIGQIEELINELQLEFEQISNLDRVNEPLLLEIFEVFKYIRRISPEFVFSNRRSEYDDLLAQYDAYLEDVKVRLLGGLPDFIGCENIFETDLFDFDRMDLPEYNVDYVTLSK